MDPDSRSEGWGVESFCDHAGDEPRESNSVVQIAAQARPDERSQGADLRVRVGVEVRVEFGLEFGLGLGLGFGVTVGAEKRSRGAVWVGGL